jgi:hypothetical protein
MEWNQGFKTPKMLTIIMAHDDMHIKSEILVLYKPRSFVKFNGIKPIYRESWFHPYFMFMNQCLLPLISMVNPKRYYKCLVWNSDLFIDFLWWIFTILQEQSRNTWKNVFCHFWKKLKWKSKNSYILVNKKVDWWFFINWNER